MPPTTNASTGSKWVFFWANHITMIYKSILRAHSTYWTLILGRRCSLSLNIRCYIYWHPGVMQNSRQWRLSAEISNWLFPEEGCCGSAVKGILCCLFAASSLFCSLLSDLITSWLAAQSRCTESDTWQKGLTSMGWWRAITIQILEGNISTINNMADDIVHFWAGMKIDIFYVDCTSVLNLHACAKVLTRLLSYTNNVI